MAISNTSIANMALVHLGNESTITSLTMDTSREARVLNLIFAPTRDALLRNGIWKFAKKRQVLATLGETPAFGYTTYYRLPSDFARMVRVNIGDYRLDGVRLATSEGPPVEMEYVALVTDPNEFDTLFVQVMALSLALDACYSLGGDAAKYVRIEKKLEQTLADARFTGAVEEPPAAIESSALIQARYGVFDDLPFRPLPTEYPL